MEYIQGATYSEYMERASIQQLNTIIQEFLRFLDWEISNASFVSPDLNVISEKICNLLSAISGRNLNPSFNKVLEILKSNIPEAPLPVGFCHGDFTLSNMIFSNNRIYLVDFLDSFIETPIIDIVKLRQDTKFHWSLLLEDDIAQHQKGKIIQVLKYYDARIINHFSRYPFYQAWYHFLEKLNLLRIVPYLIKSEELEFVHYCLTDQEIRDIKFRENS
jgi:Ser/Thr protein kinase RdoA (MazF antagonist)